MGTPAVLPISEIVDVTVNISAAAPAQPTFNQGLVIGSSAVIPSYGSNSRVRQYSIGTFAAQMLTDGFITSSPEYIAAQLYFAQRPTPQFIFIGRQDLTAISTYTLGASGTGYAVGDLVYPTQGGASNAVLKVLTVGGSGAVTALAFVAQGTGFANATGLPTTTNGSGSGLTINVTAIGESLEQAAQACRTANGAWYGFIGIGAVAADHTALFLWAQSAQPPVFYFGGTADAAVLNGTAGNVAASIKALEYEHGILIYSSLQPNSASPPVNQNPNAPYVGAAVMGMVMGLNTGLAGSFFTFKFKTIVGVIPEPFTDAQKSTVEGNNCNVILNYGNAFTFLEQGIMPNGWFGDLRINVDMLVSNLQFEEMDLLTALPAVPQTDPGQSLLLQGADSACNTTASIGAIAGGTWEGSSVVDAAGNFLIKNQETLPKGYKAISSPYSIQSTSDHQARKAMPIYIFLIYAGAAHFLVIAVNVQQ